MSFCAVDDKKENKLMVIWDLGRKCTYACTYCPPHRKNNWSATASFEELKKTADALERYHNIYNSKRKDPFIISASFTGGEPTVNPAFFDFLVYLQENYPHWKRTLTTNGFYSERKLRLVMKNTDYTTLSWHCEGTPDQKARVRENIRIMHEEGYGFKVNVMFHEREDYFNECIELCDWLEDIGVSYIPRVIGDQGDVKQGLKDKTIHTYTEEQMAWLNDYWDRKKNTKLDPKLDKARKVSNPSTSEPIKSVSKSQKTIGQSIGRPCCGGRDMELLEDNGWVQSRFVSNNNFQGWNCMINWYFLYIHQEIDEIWHHQTCQVDLNGELGPICKASEFDEFCDKLEEKVETGNIPLIRCPKTFCGCGLCVPKAKTDEHAKSIFNYHVPKLNPEFMEMKSTVNKGTLKALVYKFDRMNGNETI